MSLFRIFSLKVNLFGIMLKLSDIDSCEFESFFNPFAECIEYIFVLS